MNRSSIVVQNGNIPVIPSAPSAWNLTPPDTCSFVWAGILQQDSSDSPLTQLTFAFALCFLLKCSHPCKAPILLLAIVIHLSPSQRHFIHHPPPFSHSYILAFKNTPELLFQTTFCHFFISLKYSSLSFTHMTLCAFILSTFFLVTYSSKRFSRERPSIGS